MQYLRILIKVILLANVILRVNISSGQIIKMDTNMPAKNNLPKPLAKKVVGYLNAKEAYLFSDDSVLIVYTNGDSIRKQFSEVFKIITEKESVLNEMVDFNSFVDSLETRLRALATQFDLSDYKNFISLKTLEIIDEKYSAIIKSGISEADIFLPLVAFCGTLFADLTNGKWGKEINRRGDQTLIILGGDNKKYDPYFCIRDILVNGHHPYSFQVAIKSQLGLK
jgi:polyhydroxyalkanoate synthesis regulator phasin